MSEAALPFTLLGVASITMTLGNKWLMLQPELRRCFRTMDEYYDHVVVGLPRAQ